MADGSFISLPRHIDFYMLSRSLFSIIGGTLVILGVLIAVEPITAAPFDAEIANRGGNSDHRDLAKRLTVTTLEECYAACVRPPSLVFTTS